MNEDMAPELDDLWREAKDHVEHGYFDRAIEIYKYVLVRYADNNLANGYANAHLGEILLMRGQTDLAETHIRKALDSDPDNPHYHWLLGCVYGFRHEWKNAVKEHRLACDGEPRNWEYRRLLGEATFNSGDREMGLEYLREVDSLCPDNPGLLTELATAYMSLGELENARLCVERAIVVRPDNIMAWAVLKKIHVLGMQPNHGTTNSGDQE